MEEENSSVREENMACLLFSKKKSSEVGFERAQRGFPLGKKGKVIPCSGANDRKGTGANTGKFGMKTLQADIYYTLITLTRKEKSDLNFSKVL